MKRTQYFARTTSIFGIWRIKNNRADYHSTNPERGVWKKSIWNAKEIRAGAKSVAEPARQITRDQARKLCPKAFRKA